MDPGPKHHSLYPQVHLHSEAKSVVVRDGELGTSQSDITPRSHGGPPNLSLQKMVHFNVKQSPAVYFWKGSACPPLESPALTEGSFWIVKFSPSQSSELKWQNKHVHYQLTAQPWSWSSGAAPTVRAAVTGKPRRPAIWRGDTSSANVHSPTFLLPVHTSQNTGLPWKTLITQMEINQFISFKRVLWQTHLELSVLTVDRVVFFKDRSGWWCPPKINRGSKKQEAAPVCVCVRNTVHFRTWTDRWWFNSTVIHLVYLSRKTKWCAAPLITNQL